jgi:hypothetical protein
LTAASVEFRSATGYDHPDGRPVLRSLVTMIAGQVRTSRLDVEECRFGPIPESEFAPEPFLAGLRSGLLNRQQAVEPSIATWLGSCLGTDKFVR